MVIAALEEEEAVTQRLEALSAASIFVSVIVLGELHFGARKSSRVDENVKRLGDFARASNVLACDGMTASIYGDTKDALRRRGRPIPENDIWIAAVAIQHDLTLVSRESHFQYVENLKVQQW